MKSLLRLTVLCILIIPFVFNSCKDEETPAPEIVSINPDHGEIGSTATITGSNFAADAIVKFNGTQASVTSSSATQLIVTVPVNATSGSVTVTSNNKTTTGPVFTVEFPPLISSINPLSGIVGDQIIISGGNFSTTDSDNIVKFNGIAAAVTTASTSQLTVTVPTGSTTGNVTVEVNGKTATGPIFTVTPSVTITNVSTSSGVAGCDRITITGTGYSTTAANNVVRINGVEANISPNPTATEIVASVPATATSGMITVTTNGETANGPNFSVLNNTATTTLDNETYTYSVVCGFVSFNDDYWISASGGFTTTRPSFAINFLTPTRPTTAGNYPAEVNAERPGETWNFTPTTVDVTFDGQNRMTVVFTNVMLIPRLGTTSKAFSGVVTIY